MQTINTSQFLSAVAGLCIVVAAQAAPGWIIATPDANVRGGDTLRLVAVRPDANTVWPARLRLRLVDAAGTTDIVELLPDSTLSDEPARQSFAGSLPTRLQGLVRVDLADLPSNRLALLAVAAAVESSNPIEQMGAKASATAPAPGLHLDPLPEEEPALSANDPVYLVAGTRGGANARFQLSFKYRLLDPKSLPAQLIPALAHLHLGYTQTSIWDLAADSKPFHDTSYRPGLFWQGRFASEGSKGLLPGYLRGGFEHESNGKDGASSRSINILYLQPTWRADFGKGKTLLFAPRFYSYLDRDDNPDIARYRGYADWNVRLGDEQGWILSSRLRRGTAGHASGQFDLSLPLREPLFARTGGFLHFQIFTGYGESLLDYNVKRDAQFRVGFSIVR